MVNNKGSCSTVFNPTYDRRFPHDEQYAVPALFNAPQDAQEETERARLESAGLDHISEELDGFGLADLIDFLSILFFADSSRLRLIQEERLLIGPGPFGLVIACSSTMVLIP